MYSIFQLAAACLAVAYLIVSVFSALRMYFVHRRYVHIEFNRRKWRSFGDWAPRRLATLIVMRNCALAGVVAFVAVTVLRLAKS